MAEYENILVRQEDRVGVVQLNRPQALNALNSALMTELMHALRAFDGDDSVGCMMITGSEKAFAAGADIKQMAQASVVQMMNDPFIYYWDQLAAIAKPIVAAVSGWCLGGGCELAMACDMIVASETAKFGQPEINLGIIPGAGGTQRLTRTVGKAVAMEMVLNDRKLSAAEAQQLGLVNRVAPVEQYMDAALELAQGIAQRAPVAVRAGKEAVTKAYETTLAEGLHLERRLFTMLFATADQKEGMAAFIEKRKANWRGQ
ncbi:MAG: enoyl-CoA hydratase/isomerase family protein [Caldilineaceae bacterium]|nr:enoyl-CoA hydratase/isomerase family protein [Caldilineaceae bacterium]MCB9156869.1 enoyl-CoA hydratase/isomerase family protein [Caldilineaceae bacterium]